MKPIFLLLLACVLCTGVMAQSQSWCGTQTLYFQNNESTSPTGYEELINYPSGNTEKDESVTIKNTNGPVLIDNYIIPEGSMVNTIELEQGLRRYRYYAYVDSAVGVSQLNFTAFKRFSNGTEINFYTAMSGDIDSLTVTEYNLNHVSQNNLPIGPQDRLGIRVTANTTHSSLVTIHWVYQGSIHTSHFESGYFVCEEPATQNYAANYAEQEPISPFIPMAAVVVSMIAIAAYNNRRREE